MTTMHTVWAYCIEMHFGLWDAPIWCLSKLEREVVVYIYADHWGSLKSYVFFPLLGREPKYQEENLFNLG